MQETRSVADQQKFEDAELQALLNEDDGKTQEHLAEQLNADQSSVSSHLKAMGKIIKVGRWGPHELTDCQQENRKIVCKMLLARYKLKSYLPHIVTGDEKWIYFDNPKRNRSYADPGQPSKSTARPNRFGHKTMLCIFWDQEGPIYYELLKPSKTTNTDHYKQQLLNLNNAILEKREPYKKQHHKVIFLDDNAPSNRAKPTKDIINALSWEPLGYAAYSPDLASSDYHLFASLGHALDEQHFSYENVKSWLDDWLASKDRTFFWHDIHKLSKRWEKCIASDGYYFE
ncbi:mariner Mos1 transposase [Trichonephila clavipes]|uniref:Mariner Mos1 transposase n=1 Tax=Trichonephila clavipes TaxID=2585209 RepID=A0A8X6VYE0_TRICX|nr:mariner Mos1 transposase [Trichonephila clavipes]